MDAVSYSHADKQKQRIEKFIENPDSTSGIVTVPKTIASGETVTVPTGRVAVLPNVQVDGTLNIEGEVFIPSGSSVDFSNGIKVNGEKLTMSIPTAYHIYNGSVEATNTILTNGFSTTLYTGNGTTQAINTGVDMATQWGDDASEMFGGLVWGKSRSLTTDNWLFDSVRGATKGLSSNKTNVEYTDVTYLNGFTSTGFTGGLGINTNLATYASWNFQTTHRTSGVTNHGKPYTCHYNPYTGFTIVKYEGSGLVGHEIPHHLGRKLDFIVNKELSTVKLWLVSTSYSSDLKLNTTEAQDGIIRFNSNESSIINTEGTAVANTNGVQCIVYGWANSYFDESNKLIGNYEIGVYQGTGVAGNKVTTRGKPAWVMVKRLDSTGDWVVQDNVRPLGYWLRANLSASEYGVGYFGINSDGFILNGTAGDQGLINASGGQYLYIVVYDNDSGSGKSKYPKATDTTNLSINALVPYANGIDVNGSKVSIEYKNETITGLTLTQGKNYPYSKNDGTYGVNKYEPMYGSLRDRVVAGENPDYFDLKTMKWYSTTGGEELVTNGTFDVDISGWTGVNATLSASSGGLSVYCNAAYGNAYQLITTIIGKTYRIKGRINSNIGDLAFVQAETSLGLYNLLNYITTTTGIFDLTFVAQTTTTYIKLQAGASAGSSAIFDNISVFEVEPTIGAEITTRTYLDCIVHADRNGQVSYVEELPKTTYFDEVKANEFKGKNACTAWVNFDGTTTPPTIRDSYNVSSVIKVNTGLYDVYFKTPMNNINYTSTIDFLRMVTWANSGSQCYNHSMNKLTVNVVEDNVSTSSSLIKLQIFGGKTR